MKKNLLLLAYALLSCSVFAQIASYVPQNGLVLYLPFNGNYNDLSPTNATVTPFGGSFAPDQYYVPNKVYKCAQGENLEIATNGASPLKPTGDFSISLWVKYDGVVLPFNNINYPTFIECGSNSAYYLRYYEYPKQTGSHVDVDGGFFDGTVYYSTRYNIKDIFAPYPGWTHIAYAVKTNPITGLEQKMYVNGVLVKTELVSSTPAYGNNDIISIGGIRNTTLNGIKRFAGSLDDIAMYNRALSAQEVSSLYTGYINEAKTKEAYLSFNGGSNYVEIKTPLNLNSNNVIIEAQVYFDATTNANDGIVVSRDGNSIAGLIVQDIVGTGVRLGYMWNGSHWNWTGGPVVSYNEWHSVRLVITPTSATIYADAQFSKNTFPHNIEEFDGKLLFGDDGFGTNRRFNGKLDEIRIWKNPSQSVIDEVTSGLGITCPLNPSDYPSLVAYYTFNQGDEISTTTAPLIVKDKLGLRNGDLIGYTNSAVGAWFYGGPILDINFDISAYPITPNILSALEQKATSYAWYKQGTPDVAQNGETSRSFTASTNGNYYAVLQKGLCIVKTDPIAVTNITITDLSDNLNTNSSIQLFPNPSNGLVTLNKAVAYIAVYNNQGVLQFETSGKELDLRNLSKGSYILKIRNKNENSAHKLILE